MFLFICCTKLGVSYSNLEISELYELYINIHVERCEHFMSTNRLHSKMKRKLSTILAFIWRIFIQHTSLQ